MDLCKDAYMYTFMSSMHVCMHAYVYTNKPITYYVIICMCLYNNAFQIMYHTRIFHVILSAFYSTKEPSTTDSDANDDKLPKETSSTGVVAATGEVVPSSFCVQ